MGDSEHFLGAIFKSASSGNRLNGPVPLHLYFGVLFPTADVHGHVIKGDLLLEEFVHLTLNRVLVTCFDEGGSVVDASHCVEVFVLAREHTATSEIVVEQIFAMATVRNTVINEQLENDLNGLLAMEGQVLSIACHDLAVAL